MSLTDDARHGLAVRAYEAGDEEWAEGLIGADFGGRWQARLGSLVDALGGAGLVALRGDERVGLLTYLEDAEGVEVVYVEATARQAGVGTALIEALRERTSGQRLWLVTTNDNLDALRFYQRRGFTIVELRAGSVDEARRTLKPAIPQIGSFGIAIRDEIVLELRPGTAATPG
jgi:ribosomal protein S18 acetylase RimI-like enzyme